LLFWLLTEITKPIDPKKVSTSQTKSTPPPPDAQNKIAQISEMGFTFEQAQLALKQTVFHFFP
jgi:hypothetical protein